MLFLLQQRLASKSARNSLERYRYDAPRLVLRQNCKKSPRNLGALFLTAAAKPKAQREFRNSRIPRKTRIR
nr:hypothetical protein [uncultured Campylobacter sp.]